MILFLFEMKKKLIHWYSHKICCKFQSEHLISWFQSLDPSHCIALSVPCAPLGQPASSHILLLPLADVAKPEESPRQAAKRNGGVDRTEAQTLSLGRLHDFPGWSKHPTPVYQPKKWGFGGESKEKALCPLIIQIFLIEYISKTSALNILSLQILLCLPVIYAIFTGYFL